MKGSAVRLSLATFALLALSGPGHAQEDPEPKEVVVVGIRRAPEVVVVGKRRVPEVEVHAPPRCRLRPDDPADLVDVDRRAREQRVIAPDRTGKLVWRLDDEPVQGPTVWQRAGNAIGDYRFRASDDGTPLCMGARTDDPAGYAQLRQIVDASGMLGGYVHFSALVATRKVDQVTFWLVAGEKKNRWGRGGDTRADPIRGTHGWQQVDIVVGPIPRGANHISYGFLLHGRGDVWLVRPKLEVITREQAKVAASLPISPLENGLVQP